MTQNNARSIILIDRSRMNARSLHYVMSSVLMYNLKYDIMKNGRVISLDCCILIMEQVMVLLNRTIKSKVKASDSDLYYTYVAISHHVHRLGELVVHLRDLENKGVKED